jgi:Protein of unknown function (DUF1236)
VSHFRQVVIILALVGGATAVDAQTTDVTRDPQSRVLTPSLQLTPAQRSTIYRTILRERAPPPAAKDVRIGARVPETTQLHAVPEAIAVEVPAIRPYSYMMVDNRVLLVDPATSTVVAEIVE